MENLFPDIGDYIRVQIKTRTGVSVVDGTIIAKDESALGFYKWAQYKLDNKYWFSPQTDTVLEYRSHNGKSIRS